MAVDSEQSLPSRSFLKSNRHRAILPADDEKQYSNEDVEAMDEKYLRLKAEATKMTNRTFLQTFVCVFVAGSLAMDSLGSYSRSTEIIGSSSRMLCAS